MKKLFLVLIIFYNDVLLSSAQIQQKPVTVPSPTAFSFTQYGNITASGYSGAVQAAVPIYTFNYKDFEMPLQLSHVTTGVRADAVPGWVGTNWNFNIGGVITRQVRGLTDEFDFTIAPGLGAPGSWFPNGFLHVGNVFGNSYFTNMRNNFQPFYKYLGDHKWYRVPQRPIPYVGPYAVEEANAWSSHSYDATNNYWRGEGIRDYHPDLFTFSFLDFSGTFEYRDGVNLNIKANRNVKVERFTELLSVPFTPFPQQGGGDLIQYYNSWSPWAQANTYPKVISGFKITDDRGYVYYFGKNAEMLDNPAITNPSFEYYNEIAIEYSIDYGRKELDYWKADAWYLTRIAFPDGKKIDFNYSRGQDIYASFNHSFSRIAVAGTMPPRQEAFSAELKSPVYLTNVNSDLLRMDFFRSMADTLNVALQGNPPGYAIFPTWYRTRYQKLDSFTLKAYNSAKLAYRLTYEYDPNKRLFLKTICEGGTTGGSIACHSFDYYNLNILPPLLSDKTDHWGYFNDTYSFNSNPDSFDGLRATNAATVGAGSLHKITYPTGGFSEFEYEPNVIAKVVKDKSYEGIYDTVNTIVGGVRIKKVYNGDAITPKKLFREYFYVENYLPTLTESQLASRTSTGTLSYRPKYKWTATVQSMDSIWVSAHLLNNYTVSNKSVEFYSSSPVNALLEGQHVGYASVVERNGEGAYTIYSFTNHATNSDDTAGMEYTNFISSPYYKSSSRSMERGLLSSVKHYTNTGTLVQEQHLSYVPDHKNSDGSLPRYTAYDAQALEANDYGSTNSYLFVTGTKYSVYQHQMAESNNATTLYGGGNSVTTTTLSYYDNPAHKKVTRTVTVNSTGDSIKTYLKYPQDYPGTYLVQKMVEKGYAASVIEKIQTIKKNGSLTEEVISAELSELNLGNSIRPGTPLLRRTYKMDINGTLPLSSLTTTVPDAYTWDIIWAKDSRYKVQSQFLTYDNHLTPLLVEQADGTTLLNVTGAKGKRLVAQLKLGQSAGGTASYTSFEEEISEDGLNTMTEDNEHWRWIRTSVSSDVFSGSLSLIGEVSSRVDISPAAIFVLAKTGGAVPSLHAVIDAYGTLGSQIGWATTVKTIGSWTLYRFSYAATGKIGIKSNGNVIDELRLYPLGTESKAFMTTYTYDKGLLSTTVDENYRRTFYEYDVLGRLVLIRDDNRYIVRRYCYNFNGQAENCGTYFNTAISQSFTRNNCPLGQMGSTVTYTVPANKYSGDTPAEAQAKAQAEMNAYGQAHANLYGTCTIICNTGNCTGANKKCVNNVCETGIKVYTSSVQLGLHWWQCTYHYEWSDGSWSQNYTEDSTTQCIPEM